MSGWDEGSTTYTYQGFRADDEDEGQEGDMSLNGDCQHLLALFFTQCFTVVKQKLRGFIGEYNENGKYIYRFATLHQPLSSL